MIGSKRIGVWELLMLAILLVLAIWLGHDAQVWWDSPVTPDGLVKVAETSQGQIIASSTLGEILPDGSIQTRPGFSKKDYLRVLRAEIARDNRDAQQAIKEGCALENLRYTPQTPNFKDDVVVQTISGLETGRYNWNYGFKAKLN